MAQKSTLMAEAWRQMDAAARTKYSHNSGEDEDITEDLSVAEKRRLIIMRVAKRHQGDVCALNKLKVLCLLLFFIYMYIGKYAAVSWMQHCHNDVL